MAEPASSVFRDRLSLSGTNSDSWLTGRSDLSVGDSGSELVENSTPPLVVISSRIKNPGVLASCVNAGVVVVRYNYESMNLTELLGSISHHMKRRLALSIALLMDGKPGTVKICSHKVLTETSLQEDREVRGFFQQLVGQFLHRESQYVRLDLLMCPVASNKAGQKLLMKLKELLRIPVYFSSDILGPAISDLDESIRIGTLYFDRSRIKDQWSSQPQTMALFEKIRTVGKGAYGAAVLYRKKDDDSLVILKEINLMELSKQERTLALNEVQILSMLDHPNIISYYDNFEEDGVLMIEMEYADGGTLAQFLKQRSSQMPEQEILVMFLQMVDALRYLHEHKILHRDLKTANIFLTKEGGVKMGDFGISKVLTGTSAEAHTTVGTPFYISPEICEGRTYNAKSDIWSLGCILYEMACLERTFEGTNLPAIIHKIVEVAFPPIKGNYSEGFKTLVADMLMKKPQARPSSYDLYTLRVPALMTQEDEEEEEVSDTPPDDTTTKSFLYYLDSQSFLLRPVSTTPIKPLIDHVSVGYGHIVAVTYEHTVYSWGDNSRGQLGHGDSTPRNTPQLVEALKGRPTLRAECGAEFSIFISDNNIVMSCGRGDNGALGHGPAALQDCLKPKLIEGMLSLDTVGVACGMAHTIALTSERGALFTWGDGRTGCLGNGKNEICASPSEIQVLSAGRMSELICAVRCGPDSSMFLTDSGRVYACGNNQYNKLGLNHRQTFIGQMRRIWNKAVEHVTTQALEPTPIKELGKHRVIDMAIGPTHSCLVVETGKVFTFGRNNEGQLCSGSLQPSNIAVNVTALTGKPTMVTCTELATMVTTQENSFMVWGSRPVVQSPLHSLLSPESNKSEQVRSREIRVKDGDPPTALHKRHHTSSPNKELPGARASTDSLSQQEGVHRSSSLNLVTVPHVMVPCSDGGQYMDILTQCLKDRAPTKTKGTRDDGRTAAVGGAMRRGPSVSSESGGVEREGVILEPTPLDLVGRSGVLADLHAHGLQQPKLEGIGHYAGNVLILIEAKVSEDKSEDSVRDTMNTIRVSPPKQQLLLSKRLRDRRHVNRRRLPTPILPEFKPPQPSDFEPTLSAHLQPTRTRGDSDPPDLYHTRVFDPPNLYHTRVSDPPNLYETKVLAPEPARTTLPPDIQMGTPDTLNNEKEHNLDESMVPTWIMKELAEAISSPQSGAGFSRSDPTPNSRPTSSMDIEVIDSSSSPNTPNTLSDTHFSLAPPTKPHFFVPEASTNNDGSMEEDLTLRLPASVGVRRVSGATGTGVNVKPIRLPTPHSNRLKSALSTNAISRPTTTSTSSNFGITSKILNVKKASSNIDLVNRPTLPRPVLVKQTSAPKVQSGLVQMSSSTQQRQSVTNSPKLVGRDGNQHPLVTDQPGDKHTTHTPDTGTSSTESLDKASIHHKGSNSELFSLPKLTSRRTKGSNSSLHSIKVKTMEAIPKGSNLSLQSKGSIEAEPVPQNQMSAVETERENAAKKEKEMQEEIQKLKENMEMQRNQLQKNEEEVKELKEKLQHLKMQPGPKTPVKVAGKFPRRTSKASAEEVSVDQSVRTSKVKSSICVLS